MITLLIFVLYCISVGVVYRLMDYKEDMFSIICALFWPLVVFIIILIVVVGFLINIGVSIVDFATKRR